MILRVVTRFHDAQDYSRVFEVGETANFEERRALRLLSLGVCEKAEEEHVEETHEELIEEPIEETHEEQVAEEPVEETAEEIHEEPTVEEPIEEAPKKTRKTNK